MRWGRGTGEGVLHVTAAGGGKNEISACNSVETVAGNRGGDQKGLFCPTNKKGGYVLLMTIKKQKGRDGGSK